MSTRKKEYMREYNKTYKRKCRGVRSDPEKYRAWMKEYLAEYYQRKRVENPEEHRRMKREAARKWRAQNPQAVLACYRRFRERHPDATRKQCQKIEVRIARNIRNRVYHAIKIGRAGSAVRDLGCTIEFFKTYIASMFLAGMNWDNYGKWHLDHIVPLSSFDLSDKEHFLKAVHHTNYQPLWAVDNLKKGISMVKAQATLAKSGVQQ